MTEAESSRIGELFFLPERTCAICYHDQNPTSTSENEAMAVSGASGGVVGSAQTDITNPYETIPCGCIYCFICIATRLEAEEDDGWICLRCGKLVKECKPWSGDVLEEKVASASNDPATFPGGSGSLGNAQNIMSEHDGDPSQTINETKNSLGAGEHRSGWAHQDTDVGFNNTNG